jgi:protein-tyrosine phosphatase
LIDLHCHLLPEKDDGATSLAESLEMARLAVADRISIIACTPHILPGVYNNAGSDIRAAVVSLQGALDKENIPLALTTGADAHIAPDLLEGLRSGRILSLGGSRYVLIEPPQAIVPPRFEDHLFSLATAGYVPIITHPERLAWPDSDYGVFERVVRLGGWFQLTGGSLLGQFGRRARALSERMLEDGLVHIIASDAHDTKHRPPLLSGAFQAAASRIGEENAVHLVSTRPAGILRNIAPGELPPTVRIETMRRGGRVARS